MLEYIAFDSHRHYTLAEREDQQTAQAKQTRIEHRPGASKQLLMPPWRLGDEASEAKPRDQSQQQALWRSRRRRRAPPSGRARG